LPTIRRPKSFDIVWCLNSQRSLTLLTLLPGWFTMLPSLTLTVVALRIVTPRFSDPVVCVQTGIEF
jgi:hypothetical protein